MKNGDVLTVYEALMELSKHPETKLSVRAGYILAKDRKTLEEEARIIYEERKKILNLFRKISAMQSKVLQLLPFLFR